ncbi:HTH_Tnp_Tc3_2 domain-containing protein [Trichonephila clavipes]|nr:HTH_Tnp_Tc3_2 domain-containing protein [Trichonephila clavipes]
MNQIQAIRSRDFGVFREMWGPLCGNCSQKQEQWSADEVKAAKKATTLVKDHYLRLFAKRGRSKTEIQLSLSLYNAAKTSISRIAVSQRLNDGDLYARCPVVCIPLTVTHKKNRLAVAENTCLDQRAV